MEVDHLVPAPEIAAPEFHRSELFLCARDAADGKRALRIEEVAVLPARLRANSLACSITEFTGDSTHRRRLEVDGDIDRAADRAEGTTLDLGRSNQARGDKRTAQVVDLRPLERVARIEPGDLSRYGLAENGGCVRRR